MAHKRAGEGATTPPRVAIVDYGLGNLFSVKQACASVGLESAITSDRVEIEGAAALILTGVGAFGSAVASLRKLDLVAPIKEFIASARPLVGICLGMQLLLSESYEFGKHEGLGVIGGTVRQLTSVREEGAVFKVPHVGWSRTSYVREAGGLLAGIPDGTEWYFNHSYFVDPGDAGVVDTVCSYGPNTFCASLHKDNVWAFQFHPECSGERGIAVYRNLAAILRTQEEEAA